MIIFKLMAFVLISTFSHANGIKVVGNDQCWYKENSLFVKLSSFNDRTSLTTNKDDSLGELVRFLNAKGYGPKGINSIETYGVCGPQFKFAFRIDYESTSYCVRSSIGFEFDEVTLSQDMKGACEGFSTKDLIVSVEESSLSKLLNTLKNKGYKVSDFSSISTNYFKISFITKKNEIVEIKKFLEISEVVRRVEFSTLRYHVANEFPLKTLVYKRK